MAKQLRELNSRTPQAPNTNFTSKLSSMAAQTMSAPPSPRWRPPPWSLPSGRRPAFRRRLRELIPVWGVWMSVSATWTVASPLPALDQFLVVTNAVMAVLLGLGTILTVGYGMSIIATASRPRLKFQWFFPGLTSTPKAARWFGAAFLFPPAIAWVIVVVAQVTPMGSSFTQTSPGAWFDIMAFSISFGPVFGIGCFAACVLLARRAANRPIKQAILSGIAPSYTMAPGLSYWWDGGNWRSVADSAPADAFRSADGHYWWAGGYWVAMPPDRQSRQILKETSHA